MRIAAIDLGTNSFHLLVVEVGPDGSFIPLVREKEMLRLGDDVARDGRISPAGAQRAVDAMRRFAALAERAGAAEVVACATSAFREADNGPRLAAAIATVTGISPRIIDGEEEAALIWSAVRRSVLLERGPTLGFDLGGGSLEVMVGDGRSLWWATSLPLGVARLSAELVRHDPPSAGDRRRLRRRIVGLLGPVAATFAGGAATPGGRAGGADGPQGLGMAVGSGGTFCDLARMLAWRSAGAIPVSVNQLSFTRAELLDLHETLFAVPAAERRRLPGLEARRVDLVPAGSMVLAVAMELFGVEELTVSEWALREGMVLDAVGYLSAGASDPEDGIRRSSVLALARRCQVDETRARHVARLALALFDGTRRLHRLDDGDRERLEHSALLCDIGEHVSVRGEHKHAAYLIAHARLRGFAPEEVATLACVARYAGGGVPKAGHELFGALPPKVRDKVVRTAALVRLASALDRGRAGHVEHLDVILRGGRARVVLRSQLGCELELWAAQRQGGLFERTFGRRLELTVAAVPGKSGSVAAPGPEPAAIAGARR